MIKIVIFLVTIISIVYCTELQEYSKKESQYKEIEIDIDRERDGQVLMALKGYGYTKHDYFLNTNYSLSVAYRKSIGIDEAQFRSFIVDYYSSTWGISIVFREDGFAYSTCIDTVILQTYVYPELGYSPVFLRGFKSCQLKDARFEDVNFILTLAQDIVVEGTIVKAGTVIPAGQYRLVGLKDSCDNNANTLAPIVLRFYGQKTPLLNGGPPENIFLCSVEMDYAPVYGKVGLAAGYFPIASGVNKKGETLYQWVAEHFYSL